MTLVELLLVLGILLALAAMSWPSLSRLYGRRQLEKTTLLVQRSLVRARLDAVRRGVPYEFRYEPGGSRYVTLPAEEARQALSGTRPNPTRAYYAQRASAVPDVAWGQLPRGTRFAADRAATRWSAPVRFFPDGRATEAALDVVDSSGDGLRITVRRLTGTVKVAALPRGRAAP